MNDERPTDDSPRPGVREERAAPAATATHPPRKSHWALKLVGIIVVIPVLLLAAWTIITLNYTYSHGERAGFVQKFSQKGWVCKTWEGELAMVNMPGAAQERFAFSVRDDSVAQAVTKLMGGRVAITYQQHKGVPGSCFAETEYFVTHVQPVANP